MNSGLIFCFGPGGCGKTSVSAAISAALAHQGYRVCCVTIDPSRRLASVLGLSSPYPIDPKLVQVTMGRRHVPIHVVVLDVRRMFVRAVHTLLGDHAEKLIKNRLFQVIEDLMPGLEHYVAIDMLSRLKGHFDVVVVDTPPTRNAVAFLQAPERVATLFGNTFFTFFVHQYGGMTQKPFFWRLYQKGGAFLERFFGLTFLTELAEFFAYFEEALPEIQDIVQKVVTWIKDPHTTGMLIGYEYMQMSEMAYYLAEIRKRGIGQCGFMYNQSIVDVALPKDVEEPWVGALRKRAQVQQDAIATYRWWAKHEQIPCAILPWITDTNVVGELAQEIVKRDDILDVIAKAHSE